MAQSAVVPLPNLLPTPLARSNSIISTASSASTNSRASLRRRSRTRTRRKSVVGDNRNGGEENSKQEDAPPLPPLNVSGTSNNIVIPLVDSPGPIQHPQEGLAEAERWLGVGSVKKQTGRARALSSVNLRDVPESARGRQTKSENGSVRGVSLFLNTFYSRE